MFLTDGLMFRVSRLLRRRGGALRQGDGPMADGLLEAVRGLRLAHPELGPKPLLA